MFSSFTKRLQDSLEAVENAVAAGASSAGNLHATGTNAGSAAPDRPGTPSGRGQHGHSNSGDQPSSSASLADGALSSIRRSLTIQRAASPDPLSRTRSPPPPGATSRAGTAERELAPVTVKRSGSGGTSRLDERLRASLNKTAPSRSTTPAPASAQATPEASRTPPILETTPSPLPHAKTTPISNVLTSTTPPIPSANAPTEPTSIPLPPSPLLSPTVLPATFPLTAEPTINTLEAVVPDSDPLTPNLSSFDVPRSSQMHKRNLTASKVALPLSPPINSASILSSPPPLALPGSIVSTPLPVPISEETRNDETQDSLPAPAPSDVPSIPPPTESESSSLPHGPSVFTANPITTSDTDQKVSDRLALVEQRFSDMSQAFKRLQSERAAADNVLAEHTPLKTWSDTEALRGWLGGIIEAASKAGDEIKQLTAQIRRQDERIEELRDIHHLEGLSRTAQVDRLQAELAESEALLKAANDSSSASTATITRIQSERDQALKTAKEEEEKRVKAISLLKNVRAKGLKSEKEVEDISKERDVLKGELEKEREKSRAELEKEREKWRLREAELEKARLESEKKVESVKAQAVEELSGLKAKMERELGGKQSSYEAETANLKSAHASALSTHATRISSLETHLSTLTAERDNLFDQLQLRQAEVESSQSHLESLEIQVNELKHQLREANDRNTALTEELVGGSSSADASRLSPQPKSGTGTPSFQAQAQAAADIERRYELKLSDLRARMASLEKERTESEEDFSRNLALRSREVERLRGELAARDALKEDRSMKGNEERERIQRETRFTAEERDRIAKELVSLKERYERAKEAENEARSEQSQATSKFASLENQLTELRSREAQLRNANKTLRDELKKVQSSAALLERQRNPGVGYWASSPISQSRSNLDEYANGNGNGRPASPAQSVTSDTPPARASSVTKPEEEVNLEYLRNLILQFLEHKEMRGDLVRVMSVILRFTPAETRRLVSKV